MAALAILVGLPDNTHKEEIHLEETACCSVCRRFCPDLGWCVRCCPCRCATRERWQKRRSQKRRAEERRSQERRQEEVIFLLSIKKAGATLPFFSAFFITHVQARTPGDICASDHCPALARKMGNPRAARLVLIHPAHIREYS